jgi:hypothetical protein
MKILSTLFKVLDFQEKNGEPKWEILNFAKKKGPEGAATGPETRSNGCRRLEVKDCTDNLNVMRVRGRNE